MDWDSLWKGTWGAEPVWGECYEQRCGDRVCKTCLGTVWPKWKASALEDKVGKLS